MAQWHIAHSQHCAIIDTFSPPNSFSSPFRKTPHSLSSYFHPPSDLSNNCQLSGLYFWLLWICLFETFYRSGIIIYNHLCLVSVPQQKAFKIYQCSCVCVGFLQTFYRSGIIIYNHLCLISFLQQKAFKIYQRLCMYLGFLPFLS